ncbi:hypothetical protein [Hymenobacter sp. BT190]|uniref:hypothetical protein n=1 Tax=Hymenobacter sp. BT190 TaxID=2763505 RepID=UPI00165199C3|nr:hypothetical protein [Hymenobacter sp. BT190]MBC6699335.1 hypothetical protein [Hymenobacter sp. BT190]
MWNIIANQVDVDNLMLAYRSFHDSCIKEIAVQNREFVSERLAMSFHNQTFVRMLFQSQFRSTSVIEILFEDVQTFNWVQDERNADTGLTILFEAACFWQGDILYWAEDHAWNLESDDKNDYRWIAAKQARWRIVESGLGPATMLMQPSES